MPSAHGPLCGCSGCYDPEFWAEQEQAAKARERVAEYDTDDN